MNRWNPEKRSGYSLVEVCLALLIVAVGITACFALFPEAVRFSRKTVDNAEMTAFADYVFSTIASYASTTNSTDWDKIDTKGTTLLDHRLYASPSDSLSVVKNNGMKSPEVYKWIPFYYGAGDVQTYEAAMFTYTLDVSDVYGDGFRKAVRLEVWPGDKVEFIKPVLQAGDPYPGSTVYYREFLAAR